MSAWNALAEKVIDWLMTTSWQAAVLALLVVATQVLFRRLLSARWSYLLWLLVVGRLLLPALPESPASLYRYVPASPVPQLHFAPPIHLPAAFPPAGHGPDSTPRRTSSLVSAPAVPSMSVQGVLLVIWLAGLLALAISLVERNRRFRRTVLAGCRPSSGPVRELAGLVAREMGMTRRFEVVEARTLETPAVVGLWRTKLLLPHDFTACLSEDELALIFRHELAHLKRGDLWMNFLVCVLQIVHWFNPVLWWAFSRMRHDRELATDALALHLRSSSRSAYGETLVKLAAGDLPRIPLNPAIGILENHRHIRQRIERIARLGPKAYAWSAAGIVLLIALGLGTLTKAPAQDEHTPVVTGMTPARHSSAPSNGQSSQVDTTAVISITGTVVDISGRPIRGAQVRIHSGRGRPNIQPGKDAFALDRPRSEREGKTIAMSDDQGRFAIRDVSHFILFTLVVTAPGYGPDFLDNVDPLAGPIQFTLQVLKPGQAGGLARGHVVDPQGKPITGAKVMHFSYSHGNSTFYDGGAGSFIVPEATTDANGDFSLPFKPGYEGVGVEIFASGFARKMFSHLPFNNRSRELRLDLGTTVSGRLLKNGIPLPHREIGLAQTEGSAETNLGELTTTTDSKGCFLFKDVVAHDELEVYAKRDSLGMLGVPKRKIIRTGEPGSTTKAGDLTVSPGTTVSGQIVFSDGKTPRLGRPVQLHVFRDWTSDYQYIDLPPDNKFQLMARDGETIMLSAWITGYHLPNGDQQEVHVTKGMKPIVVRFNPDKPVPAKVDLYGRPTVSVTITPMPPPGIKWVKMAIQTQEGSMDSVVSPDGKSLQVQMIAGGTVLRTVCRAESGRLYFSECRRFPITGEQVKSGAPLEAIFATNLAGIDLKGELDSSAPRPVKHGLAIACVSSGLQPPEIHGWLMWCKSADVHPDGTFEIANLPPPTAAIPTDDGAGPLQVIVSCDGYISKDPTASTFEYAAGSQTFIPPIAHPLTIRMEPTGSARVRVLDPDGKPVPGALVQFSPNETFRSEQQLLWYASLLGSTWNDEERIFHEEKPVQLKAGELPPYQRLQTRYQAYTDQDGFAQVADLPHGLVPYTVEKTSYDMPYRFRTAGSPGKYAQNGIVAVAPGVQVRTEMKLLPKMAPIPIAHSTSPDGKYVVSVESSRDNPSAGTGGPQDIVVRNAATGQMEGATLPPSNAQNEVELIAPTDRLEVKWNRSSSGFYFSVWHDDHFDVLGVMLSPQQDQLGLAASELSEGVGGKIVSCELVDDGTLHIKVLRDSGKADDFYWSINSDGQFQGSSQAPAEKV